MSARERGAARGGQKASGKLCPICDRPMRPNAKGGRCSSRFCDGFEEGMMFALPNTPSHREATAGCVGAGSDPGPLTGAWVDAVGCTADDAVP